MCWPTKVFFKDVLIEDVPVVRKKKLAEPTPPRLAAPPTPAPAPAVPVPAPAPAPVGHAMHRYKPSAPQPPAVAQAPAPAQRAANPPAQPAASPAAPRAANLAVNRYRPAAAPQAPAAPQAIQAPQAQQVVQAPAPRGSAQNPFIYQGKTRAQVEAQNHARFLAATHNRPTPQLAPVGATNSQHWYVKELNGTFTWKSTNTILQTCMPGEWVKYPGRDLCFVRKPPTS
ncbi:MAG: hypothetical protein M1837_000976 [Sclerophora amabilis]|nr:MAG: hypothetical protein M1837_000976 [Sclerophora amabilis]